MSPRVAIGHGAQSRRGSRWDPGGTLRESLRQDEASRPANGENDVTKGAASEPAAGDASNGTSSDGEGALAGGEGLVALGRADCDRLLAGGGVGLIALPGSGAPEMRPVNFALQDHRLVLRTGVGQILDAARRGDPAAFAIVAADRFEHTGWSVVVQGRLEECPPGDRAFDAPVRPWARASKDAVVALSIEQISGRRLAERIEP